MRHFDKTIVNDSTQEYITLWRVREGSLWVPFVAHKGSTYTGRPYETIYANEPCGPGMTPFYFAAAVYGCDT